MLANGDVWGTNWLNKNALKLFLLQVQSDRIKEESSSSQ